jgi:hypothetical protein
MCETDDGLVPNHLFLSPTLQRCVVPTPGLGLYEFSGFEGLKIVICIPVRTGRI